MLIHMCLYGRTHLYICTYVRMYVCTYVHMYVCTYVRMYVCTYVCTYVRMYVCVYVRIHCTQSLSVGYRTLGNSWRNGVDFLPKQEQFLFVFQLTEGPPSSQDPLTKVKGHFMYRETSLIRHSMGPT